MHRRLVAISDIAEPPGYGLGGPTCMVDDYRIRKGEWWETIGQVLPDPVLEHDWNMDRIMIGKLPPNGV